MSRLTKEDAMKVLEMFLHKQCDLERTKFAHDANTVWNAVYMATEALKELQHYKDLEAQGRLIEQKHGKWLLERELDGTPYCFHCSICDSDFSRVDIKTATPYCPHCGAKMDEVE